MPALAPTPASVLDPTGTPVFGLYEGAFGLANARPYAGTGVGGALRRMFRLKRWQYACIATQDVLVGFAIVDIQYTANAFAFAVDLATGKTLYTKGHLGLPGLSVNVTDHPSEGAIATFSGDGAKFSLRRQHGSPSYEISVKSRELSLEAILDVTKAPPPLAGILPVKSHLGVDCTQKSCLLEASGALKIGTREISLAGAFGGLDFTHALFPRETIWQWAFALGRTNEGTPFGFNLTDGLSTDPQSDNCVWIGKELHAIGPATFAWDPKNLTGEWRVRSADGALEATFTGAGMHREDRNLGLVRSFFAQIAGRFKGTWRDASGKVHAFDALPGVTEDQRVLW